MASRLDLYWGPPGSAKSTAIAHLIKQLFIQTGKVSRVLIGDGSAATYEDMGLVDVGAVQLMDYTIRDWPISTLEQLAEGCWPVDPLDPKSPLKPLTQEIASNLGITGIEGLAMAGNYIMGDKKGALAYRSGQGEKIGQDSPIKIIDADLDAAGRPKPGTGSGRTYGGNPISHYNVGQLRLAGVIERSKMLPGWVIWTSHEKVAENKLTGEKIIGPQGVGEASTPNMPRQFGNTLHFATAEKLTKEKDAHTGVDISVIDSVYRIYTRNHYRAEGKVYTKYLATTRIAYPEMMPHYLESETPGASILEFYSIIEAAKARSKEETVRPTVVPPVAA